MKTLWDWLGTAEAAKWASLFFCAYFSLARLGETGSYWQAINTAVLFSAVWNLGRMSVKEQS